MQFQVPQFIEVEDKIFGPLTLKQAIYIGGGGGLAFLIWRFLPKFVALPLLGVVIGFAVALAFFKINGRPFIVVLESSLLHFLGPKLYLWRPDYVKKRKKKKEKSISPISQVDIPNLSEHKLRSLAWSLDINENLQNERQRSLQTMAQDINTALNKTEQIYRPL